MIWNSTQPDLPLCFQETSLIWIPCFYLLLILPYHLWQAFKRKQSLTSQNVASLYQNGDSTERNDEVDMSKMNKSNNKTPYNSINSDISFEFKRTIRKALKKEKVEQQKEKCDCAKSFLVQQFQSSLLTGLKQTTTLLMIFLCTVELFYCLFTDFAIPEDIDINGENAFFNNSVNHSFQMNENLKTKLKPIFEAFTPAIKLVTFILVLTLQYLHWRHQVVASVSLFLFWCLFVIQAIINTRSLIWNYFELFDVRVRLFLS